MKLIAGYKIQPRVLITAGLSITLVLAAALRLYGVKWGLPDITHPEYSYHPDEAWHILWARWLVHGEIIPKHFMYGGTLHYSMLSAYVYFGQILSPVLGTVNQLADAMLVGRYFVVGISLFTIFLLYETGKRLFSPTVGVLAAFLLTISPAHIFLAQNVRPDQMATFMAVLLLYISVLILHADHTKDRRYFSFAGFALGTAVALRFPLALFAVSPLAAFLLREPPRNLRVAINKLFDRRVLGLAAAALVGYAIASPHTFIYAQSLIEGLRVTWSYESGAFPDAVDRGPGIYQYGWLTLREALGTTLYGIALGGGALVCYRRTPARLLVLASIIPYFILMTFASWVVVRYTLPLVPFLALLAAAFVVNCMQAVGRYRYAVVAVTCAVAAWTLMADMAFLKVQAGRNVRDVATHWIQSHAPQDTAIVTVWQYGGDVFFNPIIPENYQHYVFSLVPGANLQELTPDRNFDYLIFSETVYKNMERLGPRHPQPHIHAFQQMLQSSRYRLTATFKEPVTFLGIDFTDNFTSQDYAIINPGIRIYRYE